MRDKAGCVCAGNGHHQLQRPLFSAWRTYLCHEERDFHGDSGRVRSRGLPAVKISGYDKRGSKAETERVLCKISGDRGRMGACQCRTAPGGVSYSLHLTAARMRPRNRCKEKILDSLPAFVYDTRGDSDE